MHCILTDVFWMEGPLTGTQSEGVGKVRYVRCHTLGPPKLWCLQKYASSEKLSQILVRDLRCKYHFQWVFFSEDEVGRSENRRDRAADLICTYAGGSSQTAQNSERRGEEGCVCGKP